MYIKHSERSDEQDVIARYRQLLQGGERAKLLRQLSCCRAAQKRKQALDRERLSCLDYLIQRLQKDID